jgi:transposase, IS5 family
VWTPNPGLVDSVQTTAANEADVAHGHALLHGQEEYVHGDAGYAGLDKRSEVKLAQNEGRLGQDVQWKIAMKRGVLKTMPEGPLKALTTWSERRKAEV